MWGTFMGGTTGVRSFVQTDWVEKPMDKSAHVRWLVRLHAGDLNRIEPTSSVHSGRNVFRAARRVYVQIRKQWSMQEWELCDS